jgi:hypothetical protein
LTTSEAATLRGRAQYAEGQLFGRMAASVLYVIGSPAFAEPKGIPPRGELRDALISLSSILRRAPARRVRATDKRKLVCIFTDGAAEEEGASCGGVAFFDSDSPPEFFGLTIPTRVVEDWKAGIKEQVIAAAELLPVLLAKLTWAARLEGSFVLYFVDNEGVRESLVSGTGRSPEASLMLRECGEAESSLLSDPWYSRVPSPSNPADAPSRGRYELMCEWEGALQVPPVLPKWWPSGSGGV